MTEIKLRDYVIIAEMPDGKPCIVKATLMAKHWDRFHESIEEHLLKGLEAEYPGAVPIRGGSGWSNSYDMPLEPEK